MKKLLCLLFLATYSSFSIANDQLLVGGTITNKKTKSRMGIICGKKSPVQIGDAQVEQCVKYEVVLLNGKKEPQFMRDLTVNYSSTPESLKQIPADKLTDRQTSDIYYDYGYYNNVDYPYFYGLFALNIEGCSDGWGWCLLLPVTAVVDTAVSLGVHALGISYTVPLLAITGLDTLGQNVKQASVRNKMIKDIVFMLNTSKVGKNRNISNKRFELFKEYL
jgi:hypothetical protein